MSSPIDELEEYDTLLDPNFQECRFANDLLLATNSTPYELDLSTSIKRIKFDIQNIDAQLDKISGDEHTKLVSEIHQDTEAKNRFLELSTPLGQINTSFQRIEKDLIKPYNEAIKTQDALKKIHQTAVLIRGSERFLEIVSKIEDITNGKNYQITIMKNTKTLLNLARLFHDLKYHLVNNANLKSLGIIRAYEPINEKKSSYVISSIQQSLRQLNEKNFANEKSSMNTFTELQITTYFHSLYLLDSKLLTETISIILNINITTSVNLLTRSLSSKALFKQTLLEVSEKALFIRKIVNNLNVVCKANDHDINICGEISKKLGITDFSLKFWSDVSTRFESKFNDFVGKGSITVQAFRKDIESLESCIKQAVIKSDILKIGEKDERVVKMLHCISKLHQGNV